MHIKNEIGINAVATAQSCVEEITGALKSSWSKTEDHTETNHYALWVAAIKLFYGKMTGWHKLVSSKIAELTNESQKEISLYTSFHRNLHDRKGKYPFLWDQVKKYCDKNVGKLQSKDMYKNSVSTKDVSLLSSQLADIPKRKSFIVRGSRTGKRMFRIRLNFRSPVITHQILYVNAQVSSIPLSNSQYFPLSVPFFSLSDMRKKTSLKGLYPERRSKPSGPHAKKSRGRRGRPTKVTVQQQEEVIPERDNLLHLLALQQVQESFKRKRKREEECYREIFLDIAVDFDAEFGKKKWRNNKDCVAAALLRADKIFAIKMDKFPSRHVIVEVIKSQSLDTDAIMSGLYEVFKTSRTLD